MKPCIDSFSVLIQLAAHFQLFLCFFRNNAAHFSQFQFGLYSPICRIRLHFHHIFRSSKDSQYSDGIFYRIKIWDYSHSESGRSPGDHIFLKALLPCHGITNQVVAKCPLGEQDNIMLSGLLDLWQVRQYTKQPHGSPLDFQGLPRCIEAHCGHFLIGISLLATHIIGTKTGKVDGCTSGTSEWTDGWCRCRI